MNYLIKIPSVILIQINSYNNGLSIISKNLMLSNDQKWMIVKDWLGKTIKDEMKKPEQTQIVLLWIIYNSLLKNNAKKKGLVYLNDNICKAISKGLTFDPLISYHFKDLQDGYLDKSILNNLFNNLLIAMIESKNISLLDFYSTSIKKIRGVLIAFKQSLGDKALIKALNNGKLWIEKIITVLNMSWINSNVIYKYLVSEFLNYDTLEYLVQNIPQYFDLREIYHVYKLYPKLCNVLFEEYDAKGFDLTEINMEELPFEIQTPEFLRLYFSRSGLKGSDTIFSDLLYSNCDTSLFLELLNVLNPSMHIFDDEKFTISFDKFFALIEYFYYKNQEKELLQNFKHYGFYNLDVGIDNLQKFTTLVQKYPEIFKGEFCKIKF